MLEADKSTPEDATDSQIDNELRMIFERYDTAPAPVDTSDILWEKFAHAATGHRSTFERVAARDDIPAAVSRYFAAAPCQIVVGTDPFASLDWGGISFTDREISGDDTIGLTHATVAISDIGALFVSADFDTAPSKDAIKKSLLPPTHIVAVNKNNIVPTLAHAFAMFARPLSDMHHLIAGPSRTADIAQTLTIGAHGPTAVHIIMVENSDLPPAES